MENTAEQKIVKPHHYPRFVKISAFVVALLFTYSLFLVPSYISAARLFRQGEAYFTAGHYDQAIETLEQVVNKVPSSRKTRLLLAKAYFSNQDQADNEIGLYHISDISIDGREWEELIKVMPIEYKDKFQEIE